MREEYRKEVAVQGKEIQTLRLAEGIKNLCESEEDLENIMNPNSIILMKNYRMSIK